MECINTVNIHRKNNKINENKYKNALLFLKQNYTKMPNTKNITNLIENLTKKRNALLTKYYNLKKQNYKLNKIRTNYEKSIHIKQKEK